MAISSNDFQESKLLFGVLPNFDFDNFKKKLKNLTKDIFLSINSNEICGFCLFSDAGAMSLSASFNTRSYLENNWKKDPENKEYYRWYAGEWFDDGIPNDELDNLSWKLFNAEYSEDFTKHKNKLFNTIVNVLKELNNEGFFNSECDDFVLVFCVTDPDGEDRDNELKWMRKLNNKVIFKEYENWAQKEYEN